MEKNDKVINFINKNDDRLKFELLYNSKALQEFLKTLPIQIDKEDIFSLFCEKNNTEKQEKILGKYVLKLLKK